MCKVSSPQCETTGNNFKCKLCLEKGLPCSEKKLPFGYPTSIPFETLSGFFGTFPHDGLSQQGMSLLHLAAEYGNLDIVKAAMPRILSAINDRDKNGYTPLDIASRKGHKSIVGYLKSKGGDGSYRAGRDGLDTLNNSTGRSNVPPISTSGGQDKTLPLRNKSESTRNSKSSRKSSSQKSYSSLFDYRKYEEEASRELGEKPDESGTMRPGSGGFGKRRHTDSLRRSTGSKTGKSPGRRVARGSKRGSKKRKGGG